MALLEVFPGIVACLNRSIHISNPEYASCEELPGLLDIEKELQSKAISKACIVGKNGS